MSKSSDLLRQFLREECHIEADIDFECSLGLDTDGCSCCDSSAILEISYKSGGIWRYYSVDPGVLYDWTVGELTR